MHSCPQCQNPLELVQLHCPSCEITFSGRFIQSRLGRLSGENSRLAERFILSGGNLKDLASEYGITYPTMRKKVDGLIEALKQLQENDNRHIDELLKQVERGEKKAEEAARLIKEIAGGI